jgi:transcriptional regulator with XRE-family HTH domain
MDCQGGVAVEFREKLKKARKAAKITQSRLAELLGFKGKQAISNWEHGLSQPSIETLSLLAQHLGVSIDYFFTIEDSEDTVLFNLTFDLNDEKQREIYNRLREEAKKNNRTIREEIEILVMSGFYQYQAKTTS